MLNAFLLGNLSADIIEMSDLEVVLDNSFEGVTLCKQLEGDVGAV